MSSPSPPLIVSVPASAVDGHPHASAAHEQYRVPASPSMKSVPSPPSIEVVV
jgi:hypothetical protein